MVTKPYCSLQFNLVCTLTIRKSAAWIFTGRLVYAMCQWLILVVVAKLSSPEVLGEFTLALAVTAPIVIFSQLNTRAFVATDAMSEYTFSDYLVLRIITTMLAVLVILFASIAINLPYAAKATLLGVALFKAFESISDIYYGWFQKQEKMKAIGLSAILHGVLSLSTVVVFMMVDGQISAAVYVIAALWFMTLIFYDARKQPETSLPISSYSFNRMWQLTKICLPLGFAMLLVSLNINIPVYFVKAYLSTKEVGYFSAIVYFMFAGRLITGALAQASAPRLSQYYAKGQRALYSRLLLKLLVVGAILGLGGVGIALGFGQWLLTIAYGPDYGRFSDVFVWIMIAAGFSYLINFLGVGLTVARLFKAQLFLNLLSAFTVVILSIVWIPANGLLGAGRALAGGIAIAFIANLSINIFVAKSFVGIRRQVAGNMDATFKE
ncbi:MAG TPA: lipopolysaccharide biosynthesis protein [Gammaproteobacteria bacterium]|nr:lipopolysaccharide biosynthesis protein [Gammaproteobacteria bacterium]